MLATDVLTAKPTFSLSVRKSGDSLTVLDSRDAVVANASLFFLISSLKSHISCNVSLSASGGSVVFNNVIVNVDNGVVSRDGGAY